MYLNYMLVLVWVKKWEKNYCRYEMLPSIGLIGVMHVVTEFNIYSILHFSI